MTKEARQALKDIAATKQMVSFNTANTVAMRVVMTAFLAGVPLTEARVTSMLDVLAPRRRDPNGEFRHQVLKLIDDIQVTVSLLKQ